jgi:hypothetical protein
MSVIREVEIIEPLESNGAIPVNIQDQTSQTIDTYFLQQTSSFTISVLVTASTATVLSYTFTATAGHGIVATDEILLLDTAADKSFYATVLNVATNVITVDRPIDHAFAVATTLGRIVTSEMAVNGSVTPQIYTVRAGTNPIDITRLLITMLDTTAMDDGRFAGQGALTRGLVFRKWKSNTDQKTIFCFKTNGEIRQFCYDVNYLSSAPAGENGLGARITFGGPSKHGVTLRVENSEVLQIVVQDNLTGLTSLKIAAEGHEVTD